ncbi:MAG: type II secretion system F family protein, partial [Pseudomonadota bacterium]
MTIQEILFLMLLFIAVFSILSLIIYKLSIDPARKRASSFAIDQQSNNANAEFVSTLVKVIDPIGRLALPSEGWDKSPLQLKFVNAGWRSTDAPKLYFGIKSLLTISFPIICYFFLDKSVQAENASGTLFIIISFAALGYYLPNIVLSKIVKKRQLEIVETLPDATDLLIICMEAGLSFDQALSKVASEIKLKSEVLSQELELLLIEVRSGFTRERALRNLALRTGVEEIDSLATMVIQSERFGTSIGDALRIHAETARTKRRQRAEETASKIALKLLFPLLFCLMPAIFVVLLVPSLM